MARPPKQPAHPKQPARPIPPAGPPPPAPPPLAAADESEAEFLARYDASVFPRPSVTVDAVLLTVAADALCALLLRRGEHPHRGRYALPGGFVREGESLDDAARRVLAAKTGLQRVFLEQLFTFGAPGRDPRTRVISVAYYALVDAARFDAARARHPEVTAARLVVPWAGEAGGPVGAEDTSGAPLRLAFDHADILGTAVLRLRGKLNYAPVGFELLPERFTLLELQRVHEAIRGERVNKDSFRRRLLAGGHLVATGELQQGVLHRPAELYRVQKTRPPSA